ncbi:cation:proton antiporter [candidate division WOR-3 bacterium]|uniref:Cation:proton antiporter n=1 Tax=candidate division WOR-3 bacterium TaxID=2052148 RepID=A0A660SEN0_UNCW3|nr:MAG: cation:proton antiporter [candidate division WOR-3 bacterium]
MNTLFSAGIIFLGSLLMMRLSNRFRLPSVTGYLIFGVLIGPYVANLIAPQIIKASGMISNLALSFIAFGLGQNFTLANVRKIGKMVIAISIGEVVGSFLVVSLALWLIGRVPLSLAIIFGAIAPATAPAAVVMVTREFKARGPFTDTLLSVVAIDDAWGIILFAFCLALAKVIAGMGGGGSREIVYAFTEVGGSLVLGGVLGYLLALSGRFLRTSTELLITTIGFIALTAGIAAYLKFSILLANMALGTSLVNSERASGKYFETIQRIDTPFYLLFFVLAGAHLELPKLLGIGVLSLLFILTRLPGEMLGAYIGAVITKAEAKIRRYIGLGLAPQAGVALGLALIAFHEFPQFGDLILSTIIVTTIIYEIFGPILTRIALEKAGEIG